MQQRETEQVRTPDACTRRAVRETVPVIRIAADNADEWIERGLEAAARLFSAQFAAEKLECTHIETERTAYGMALCLSVDAAPPALRRIAEDLAAESLVRFFEIGIRTPGEPADRIRHAAPPADASLRRAVIEYESGQIAGQACRALLYEVCTTPKPGLVDRKNSGSHADMDIFTFMDSAAALWPYFARCAETGADTAGCSAADAFAALRPLGRLAEGAMLAATGGVNTHKGAIFSLGTLCAAMGRLSPAERGRPEAALKAAADMTAGITERDFSGITRENAVTTGEKLYAAWGITGVRGQAEAGFPAVRDVGLPVLERGVRDGMSLNDAGRAALLHMLAAAVDTNLIARSDLPTQRRIAAQAAAILEDTPYPDETTLDTMDAAYIRQNLSPGGSADLLTACYFLYFMKEANG